MLQELHKKSYWNIKKIVYKVTTGYKNHDDHGICLKITKTLYFTLGNSKMRFSYMNTDSYLKFSPDSENDNGFAMLGTVFK